MKRLISGILVTLLTGCASAPQASKDPSPPMAPKAGESLSVVRYTDRPLSEFQTLVMNEATKLSFACRMFRTLYGRWPQDIREIASRTEGIDFGVFLDRAKVTPQSDDSAIIEIFDGQNTRAVKAVPVDLGVTEDQRKLAQNPAFRIQV